MEPAAAEIQNQNQQISTAESSQNGVTVNGHGQGLQVSGSGVSGHGQVNTQVQRDATSSELASVSESRSCFETERRRLKKILARKQHERALELARLGSQYKLEGNSKSQEIVALSWDELVQGLQSRRLTAVAVLEAYIGKAVEVNGKYNSVTDFIPQAHEWVRALDALPAVKGPLHGIPICIKDDTNVEGMDATHGFVKRLYKPAKESAAVVKVLQDLGAVPFCKTNVPQTLFTYGSDNPVFGTTGSAVNPKLSAGGSSSGTGSLVGSHGAMFGTGTDIGGSLRIPAHFNGCSAIKPTAGRISDKGLESSLPNIVGLTPCMGIIGRTATIVASVFQHLADHRRQLAYDPLVYPVPWDAETFKSSKKLRIGYFTSIPFFPPLGDTEDVVLNAKTALEKMGHTLVPFKMPDGFKYMNIFARILLADRSRYFAKGWKGEDVAKGVFLVWLGSKIPLWFQRVLGGLMRCRALSFMYSTRTAAMFGACANTSQELWDTLGEKRDLIQEMVAEWQRLELDTVLCPLFPFPAPPADMPGLLPMATCYSAIWNLVEFPAGVLPFGYESGKKLDAYKHDGDVALKMSLKATKESIGSPIAVQVVGLPFKEEVVLRVMQELDQYRAQQNK